MPIEYQIDIQYTDGSKRDHLTYRFENAELRNEIYRLVCSQFSEDQVDMEHLRNHGGIMISNYTYREPTKNQLPQFINDSYFRMEVLNRIIELIKRKAIGN